MSTVLAISGSLRKASLNSALLRAAVETAPAGLTIRPGTIRGIPLYDGDVEASSGIPAQVVDLKEQIVAADALLLVTPEYNNSLPGVFKNAIDWLSRPSSDIPRVFGSRPVAIMGASPNRFGTLLSQTAWLPVVRVLGMRPWYEMPMYVSSARDVFDDAGNLVDDSIRQRLAKFLAGFARFIEGGPR